MSIFKALSPLTLYSKKVFAIYSLYMTICMGVFLALCLNINAKYAEKNDVNITKTNLLRSLHTASPALVPAGRNIAFETGNAVSNAPASYLTMLDCCESDEAIASRISIGKTSCTIIKREK